MCLLLLGDSPGSTDEDPGSQQCANLLPAVLPPGVTFIHRVRKIRMQPRLSNTIRLSGVSCSCRLGPPRRLAELAITCEIPCQTSILASGQPPRILEKSHCRPRHLRHKSVPEEMMNSDSRHHLKSATE